MHVVKRFDFRIQLLRLTRIHVAPASWDPHLRTCSVAACIALVIALVVPAVGDLAAFFVMMLVACGPTSSFLPAASEPLLMAYGQVHPPLLIAVIGVGAVVVVEFLNYSVFDSMLHWHRLAKIREAKPTRLLTRWFTLQPFATVSVAALTPVPFWIARSCAVLSRYSKPRYMCATAVGRFFRLYLISAIGTALPFSALQILVGGAGVLVVLGGVSLAQHNRDRPRRLGTCLTYSSRDSTGRSRGGPDAYRDDAPGYHRGWPDDRCALGGGSIVGGGVTE